MFGTAGHQLRFLKPPNEQPGLSGAQIDSSQVARSLSGPGVLRVVERCPQLPNEFSPSLHSCIILFPTRRLFLRIWTLAILPPCAPGPSRQNSLTVVPRLRRRAAASLALRPYRRLSSPSPRLTSRAACFVDVAGPAAIGAFPSRPFSLLHGSQAIHPRFDPDAQTFGKRVWRAHILTALRRSPHFSSPQVIAPSLTPCSSPSTHSILPDRGKP